MSASLASFLDFYFARAVFVIQWIIWIGVALQTLLASPRAAMRAASLWPAILMRRGTILAEDSSSHDALESLQSATNSVLRRSNTWEGIGALLGVLTGGLWGAPLFLAPSTLLRDLPTLALALTATTLLRQIGSNAGGALGFAIGQRLLELTPEGSAAYDDRRSGRTSDFRTPLLLLAPIVLFLMAIALTVLTVLGLLQPFTHWDLSSLYALATPFLLLSLPGITVAAFILFEILAKRVAQAPQRTYSFNASPAREADVYLRAISISALYRSEVTVAANALIGQWIILVLMGSALADTTTLVIFIAIIVLYSLVIGLANRRIARNDGRLGGRLTGWPWQKNATPQATG